MLDDYCYLPLPAELKVAALRVENCGFGVLSNQPDESAAQQALADFAIELDKTKHRKTYCKGSGTGITAGGHFSYSVYLLRMKSYLVDGLFCEACSELSKLIHFEDVLQNRIKKNLLCLFRQYL